MKYESAILKRLIDTYGVVGNPQYISEIIKEFIIQGKECYPDLFTYQADWLAHIDEFGLNPSYTVTYTGQSIYAPNTLEKPVKSAILSGSTKYRDIDTGEFLETFEEDRNLELVSVKTPVLTTTGKNLFKSLEWEQGFINSATGDELNHAQYIRTKNYIDIQPNTTYTATGYMEYFMFYDSDKNFISGTKGATSKKSTTFTTPSNARYLKLRYFLSAIPTLEAMLNTENMLELGEQSTGKYEPYKSNILTVNEDVTLRSNGNICDELNLITGQLTQRIDEDGEVLSQEVVKTVDLSILDQNGQNVKQLMTFNGGTHFNTGSSVGSPLPTVSVSVETDLEETLMMCSLEGNTL